MDDFETILGISGPFFLEKRHVFLTSRGQNLSTWSDTESFNTYLSRAKSVGRIEFDSDNPQVVIDKLDLFAKDGIHLLNAGAALFCSCRTNDVQMAKFATNTKTTLPIFVEKIRAR